MTLYGIFSFLLLELSAIAFYAARTTLAFEPLNFVCIIRYVALMTEVYALLIPYVIEYMFNFCFHFSFIPPVSYAY
jgi:hypothetical protein